MSNGWGRRGAGRHEMRTSNLDRLTVATAEHLLDGGEGPADLRQLLAAAAGPGTARELAGEAAAVAAFVDAQRASSLPSAPSRRPSMLSTALSKIVAAKAVAAVVLVAGATGGVALAATASSADAPPADRPAATRTATPAAGAGDRAENGGENHGESGEATSTESENARSAVPAPPAEPDPSLTGLCNAWAAGATDNPGKAAENPAFGALADAAGSPEAVDGYCDDLADDAPGAKGNENANRPTEAPGNPDHSTGQPTAAPGNPDHPTGPPADDAQRQNDAAKAGGSSSGGSDNGDDDSDD